MIAEISTNSKPSAFLSRKEATLNYLVKQVQGLDLESLTSLGAVLLDAVDARKKPAEFTALSTDSLEELRAKKFEAFYQGYDLWAVQIRKEIERREEAEGLAELAAAYELRE